MKQTKHNIFVTRQIPRVGIELLNKRCEIDIFSREDIAVPRDLLMQKVEKIEGLLCLLSDKIDREVIDRAPNLKVISNYAVGFNNIDVEYASQKGILVTNTPGVLTDATADLTWALLLAVARRVVEGDRMVRSQGKFSGWGPMLLLGHDLKNRTLGIIGAGRIGSAVAERSRGWNMNVLYHSNRRNRGLEENSGARRVSFDDLLSASDFVSLHVPLTPETHHMIDENAFLKMKSSAYLINTSRGPVVDEAALVKALREKQIAGAGLDVYENEPVLSEGLSALDNVVLLPHIGSATVRTRDEMARIAARNLLAVLAGERPLFPVNPELLEN